MECDQNNSDHLHDMWQSVMRSIDISSYPTQKLMLNSYKFLSKIDSEMQLPDKTYKPQDTDQSNDIHHHAGSIRQNINPIFDSKYIGELKESDSLKNCFTIDTVPRNTETIAESDISSKLTPINEQCIMREQLTRNYQLFGDHSMNLISNALVVIVGLGGVGSHCAISLIRSGICKMRVIDFDMVTLSSLNRHAVASRKDVGKSKVATLMHYAKSISPHIMIQGYEVMYDQSQTEALIKNGNPDFVIDCIDNVPTKIHLLQFCVERDIRVVSACGAGAKLDPSQLILTDISDSTEDKLASQIRIALRKVGIVRDVPICYSTERNDIQQIEELREHQKSDPQSYAVRIGFRVRTIPVYGPVPAAMGQMLSAYVLQMLSNTLLGLPVSNQIHKRNFKTLFEVLKQRFGSKSGGTVDARSLQLPYALTCRLYIHVWRGESVDAPRKWSSVTTQQLVPWYFKESAINDFIKYPNMVLMTYRQAQKHLSGECANYETVKEEYDADVIRKVTTVQETINSSKMATVNTAINS